MKNYAKGGRFQPKEYVDVLKFGCNLLNLAKNCLHKSIFANFYPLSKSDKKLLERIREDVAGGITIAITRKTKADKFLVSDSLNKCKAFVGVDVSQL